MKYAAVRRQMKYDAIRGYAMRDIAQIQSWLAKPGATEEESASIITDSLFKMISAVRSGGDADALCGILDSLKMHIKTWEAQQKGDA